jgi:hypothetical protein
MINKNFSGNQKKGIQEDINIIKFLKYVPGIETDEKIYQLIPSLPEFGEGQGVRAESYPPSASLSQSIKLRSAGCTSLPRLLANCSKS